jgi:hypothetical protein
VGGDAPVTNSPPPADPVAIRKAAQTVLKQVGGRDLEQAVRLGCRWLCDTAQVRTERLENPKINPLQYPYSDWQGAIRNEYRSAGTPGESAVGKWSFFGTVWHTGQACKALALASHCLNDDKILDGAKRAAGFLRRQQITDPNDADHGMIASYEDPGPWITTSCMTECCDGLFTLADVTGDDRYAQWATDAVCWCAKKLYAGDGVFHDAYVPSTRKLGTPGWKDRWGRAGRPLWDDGVWLKAAKHANRPELRKIFFEVADRLLHTEDPPGNWMAYTPCDWRSTSIHPRQAFWFGRPMWMAYRESGRQKYRDCFDRACQWYVRAMRHDGGILRATYADFNTDSFGHANSGTACACMMFRDQYAELGNTAYLPHLVKGLKYLQSVQFVEVKDPNLRGAILEKVLPPKGSDACPWHVRDIGTSFFITAASQVLLDAASQATKPTKTT